MSMYSGSIYHTAERWGLTWEWDKNWFNVYVDGHHYTSYPKNKVPKASLEMIALKDVIDEINQH